MDSALPPPPPIHTQRVLDTLLASGSSFGKVSIVADRPVRILNGVNYGNDGMQKLDIYFPESIVESYLNNPSPYLPPTQPSHRPVLVHVHGGGWARGGRASFWHGAPSICSAAAANGMVAVSVGYRLGQYPLFCEDVAKAIQWVKDNIEVIHGDSKNVFLSGHSAGAHIASLVSVRHDHFLSPLGVPRTFFKGLMLISGVYNLFAPLSKALLDVKNKGFVLLYVLPSFGLNKKLRREASPLVLLENDTDTTLAGTAALAAGCTWGGFNDLEKEQEENKKTAADLDLVIQLPPTLIFNCTMDVGLQQDGKNMAKAVAKYTSCDYEHIDYADHGSICRSEKTHQLMHAFMQKHYKAD